MYRDQFKTHYLREIVKQTKINQEKMTQIIKDIEVCLALSIPSSAVF
jgi:hypothetical protein